MTFALTGDSIITRMLAVYSGPAFMRIINLVRSADAAAMGTTITIRDGVGYVDVQRSSSSQ